MKVQYPEIQIALDDVITAFHKMQKNRGHPVTQDHINKFKAFDWTQSQINPLEVINPYDNFRDIPLSRNGLTMKEVLEEVIQSKNVEVITIISKPLVGAPPVIVFHRYDSKFQVDDGCGRLLAACKQDIKAIDAFIGRKK
ncbi:hypothetical protein J4230_02590 [Candidatus Woesearchaeota archaeon]|nr:hypothetical protein [Candidatus Woesearchaeota archaeon]